MAKSMIIVGAGIAGLATGCYARMNGYETDIYEMHTIPGGLCTGWKRKGYTFDISMHFLTASKSGPLHQMWGEIGAMDDQDFHYHDEMARIEGRNKALTLGADAERLEREMLALSPADAKRIKELVRLASGRDMSVMMALDPPELIPLIDKLKGLAAMLPMLPTLVRYGNRTVQDFAASFEDPFLRDAVRFVVDTPAWPMPKFPMAGLMGMLRFAVSEGGTPIGGSQGVAFKVADRYERLGGEIHYKRRVTDVIVEDDRAVGIRLEDGKEERADIVVWAADGRTVIYDILGGRYLSDQVRRMYSEWTPVAAPLHVMLGIDRDLSDEPHLIILETQNPITVAGQALRWLCVRHRCYDPSTAPPGKTSAEVWYATPYEYWEELARDQPRYKAEKQRIADFTIAEMDRRWPGLAEQVEVVDVPTPATYVRYTGNWRGSPDGWYMTTDNMMARDPLRTLPGLSGFYMVGQWTQPYAGVPGSALSGRQLVQIICAQEGRAFRVSQ